MKVKPFKLKYQSSDFKIIKAPNTGDLRIAYTFKAKDGTIEANFFWYEGMNAEVRGVVLDKKTGYIIADFGFVYVMGEERSKDNMPSIDTVMRGVLNQLNNQQVKWFKTIPDD